MRGLLLCVAIVSTSARAQTKGHSISNRTLGTWSIAKCDFGAHQPSPTRKIPEHACARRDLVRHDLCSLLSKPPAEIPSNVMANARLHSDRRVALQAHVTPETGARMVEVGTMTGVLAKYLIRYFRPSELVVMDVDSWAIGQCKGRTVQVARETQIGTNVSCIKGDSKVNLQALPDNTYDLIYIDGAHDYNGVCNDVCAAMYAH